MSYLINQAVPVGFSGQAYAEIESDTVPGNYVIIGTGSVESYTSADTSLYLQDLTLSPGGASVSATIANDPPNDSYKVTIRSRNLQSSVPDRINDVIIGVQHGALVFGASTNNLSSASSSSNNSSTGLSSSDIAAIASDLAADLPTGATPAQIAAAVIAGLPNQITAQQVADAVTGELPAYPTVQDIATAVVANLPAQVVSPTASQIATAVVADLPTPVSSPTVSQIVSGVIAALPTTATPAQIAAAVVAAMPANATPSQVAAAVVAALPTGLTVAQVQAAAQAALSSNSTETEIEAAITAAIGNQTVSQTTGTQSIAVMDIANHYPAQYPDSGKSLDAYVGTNSIKVIMWLCDGTSIADVGMTGTLIFGVKSTGNPTSPYNGIQLQAITAVNPSGNEQIAFIWQPDFTNAIANTYSAKVKYTRISDGKVGITAFTTINILEP